ncbi:MAG TPA: hypothetical protein VIN07_04390 [Flavipsychrobacter sp.]
MKKLLMTLSFLPLAAMAQDAIEADDIKATPYKNEIGISTGLAPSFFKKYSGTEVWVTTRLTYLHNMNNTQLGLILEGSALPWDDGNIIATIVLNKKFPVGKSYFYVGSNAGFYYADAISKSPFNDVKKTGYTLGIQAGLSLHLSNRFSFFSEIGARSTQYWFEDYYRFERNHWGVKEVEWIRYIDNGFLISLPGTMGIRYRF